MRRLDESYQLKWAPMLMRGAMTSVQRALNWAARAGLLKCVGGKSPLASLEKPQQGRREQGCAIHNNIWLGAHGDILLGTISL